MEQNSQVCYSIKSTMNSVNSFKIVAFYTLCSFSQINFYYKNPYQVQILHMWENSWDKIRKLGKTMKLKLYNNEVWNRINWLISHWLSEVM